MTDVICERLMPDGKLTGVVMELFYGRARLCVGPSSDKYGFDDAW
jgi:hypothetical protein